MNGGLSWGGMVFMLASWLAIAGVVAFCFGRILGGGGRK